MRYIVGDLWTAPADVRCITTNGVTNRNGEAVMGRGCAKQAAERFPELPRQLGEWLTSHGNMPMLAELLISDGVELLTFPVKHHWRDRASTALIERSAIHIVQLANVLEWQRIVVPRPGCGNGGLSWRQVEPILEGHFDDRFNIISQE